MNPNIFDRASCDLGEMTTTLGVNGSTGETLLTVEEIKKFFRYFFVGAGFVDKPPSELYRFDKPGVTEEFTTKLLQTGVLEEVLSRSQVRYGVASAFRRPIQKLVNENNMSKPLRDLFKEFLGR